MPLCPLRPDHRRTSRQAGPCYDAVCLFRIPVAHQLMATVRQLAPRARLVFHTVDLHHLRIERQARLLDDPWLLSQASEIREQELRAASRADATIVVSRHELEVLRGMLPQANLHFLPYTADPCASAVPFEPRKDILFLGGFHHEPNGDAVRAFVERILPRIHESLPTSFSLWSAATRRQKSRPSLPTESS